MLIDLNSQERWMLIAALKEKSFKAKIQEPKQGATTRYLYKQLLIKLAKDELLHQRVKGSLKSD